MEIEAIGLDLIEIDRVEKLIDDRRFLERIFTPAELDYCFARKYPARSLAARFAAKEAVGKAIGVGIGTGKLNWKDVEVMNGEHGPEIKLNGKAGKVFAEAKLLISLTHTDKVSGAVAFLRCKKAEWEKFRK